MREAIRSVRLSLLLLTACAGPPTTAPFLDRVRALYGDVRPYVPRLSSLSAHRSCAPPQESTTHSTLWCGEQRPSGDPPSRDALSGEIARALGTSPSVDALHAAALIDLLTQGRRPASVRRSIERLTLALALDSTRAEAWSDIAIAHLIRGDIEARPLSRFEALSAIGHALHLAPQSPATTDNAAIVAASLGLTFTAQELWERARATSDPRWDREITVRRRLLSDRLAEGGRLPDAATRRQLVTDTLLVMWARAQEDQQELVQQALAVGHALAAQHGDSTVIHLAEGLAHTRDTASARRAIETLHDAAKSLSNGLVAQALATLDTAEVLSRKAAIPSLSDWVVLERIRALFRLDRFGAIELLTRGRLANAAERRDLFIAARIYWVHALVASRRGLMGPALISYSHALRGFASIGERELSLEMALQRSLVQLRLGQDAEALRTAGEVLEALASSRQWERRHARLLLVADLARDLGLPYAATAIDHESRLVARMDSTPRTLSESFARLALDYWRIGNQVAAQAALDSADRVVATIPDEGDRTRIDADIAMANGAVHTRDHPADAIRAFDRAETLFLHRANAARRLDIPISRAQAHLRMRDTAAALFDLTTALSLVEAQAADSATGARAGVVLAQRAALGELASLALARHDTVGAAEFALRGIGIGRTADERVSIRRRLRHAGVVTVQFVGASSSVLIFAYATDGLRVARIPDSPDVVAAKIEAFTTAIRRADDAVRIRQMGAALYARWFRVLLGDNPPPRLQVLSGGALEQLPIAALSPDGKQYLVERAVIWHSSIADFSASQQEHRPRRPLIVADPAYDTVRASDLRPLHRARAEAAAISAMYPGALRLLGSEATPRRLAARLVDRDMLHFAGHARAISSDPSRSHLVLAPESADDEWGALYASDVAQLRLGALQLVVLSACGPTELERSTLAIADDRGLPQSFLRAGVQRVVSSLWEADDAGTAALMVDFHSALSHGHSPADALAAAQRAAIRSSRSDAAPVRVWSAFRLQAR